MQTQYIKINPAEIQFLRPLDQLMKFYLSNDKQYFCQLFERKKQLINKLLSIGVDSQKYFAFIAKIFKSQSNQKQYARADLLSLKEKHKMNKETWFEQIVAQTQMSLTQQQTKYNQIQVQIQKPKPVVPQQQNSSNNLNINIVQFTNLKLLDQFLNKYYETPYKQTFIELYEKKNRVIGALQNGSLKMEQYLLFSQKVFSDTKNEQVKKIVKNDLEMLNDLHDNNVQSWLKQAIKQAKQQLPKQKQTYQMHKKGITVHKRQPKVQIELDNFAQLPIPDVDPSQCVSFIILDRYMKQNKNNPQIYITLYEKKQKLLKQLEENKLNQKTYQQMLKRMMNGVTNQDLKQIYKNELDDIQDIHEGNIKQWFDNIVQETNISLMIQQDIYHNYKKQYKAKPVEQKKPQQPKQQIKQQAKQQTKQKVIKLQSKQLQTSSSNNDPILGYNLQKMLSLKVIQNAILANQKNINLFIKLFAQKKKIIDMMSKGELNAQKYKKIQQKLLIEFKNNQDIKDQINFDIQGIQDFHDGDVQQWFKEVVQNAGTAYQAQLTKYQELIKNQNKSSSNQLVTKSKQQTAKNNIQEPKKPIKKIIQQEQIITPFNVDKMYSLKVLDNALTQHEKDQKVYMKIFSQKKKIFKQMQNGEIDAQKYKALQQKMVQVFADNEQIKDQIEFQLNDIEDMHDGNVNLWFEEIVNNAGVGFDNQLERYLQLDKKYNPSKNTQSSKGQSGYTTSQKSHEQYESPQKQFESKLSQASNHINQSTPKSKIRFYLHQMAVWQSFYQYYKKHGLDSSKNQLLKIYVTVPRQEIDQIIQKIKKQPQYNIVSYCKKFFPPITEAVFYKGSQNFQDKLKQGINACNKQVDQFKEYIKNLRKGLNTKNLQKVKQKVSECQSNIKYLTDFSVMLKKSNKLIPLPLLQQISVSYPNMDQFTHLQQNEVQLKIIKVQGMKGEQLIKVYCSGQVKYQHKIKNGDYNDIVIKGKQNSSENFMKILKGDLQFFSIQISQIGWFSNTKIGHEPLQMLFIRTNIHEGKVKVGNVIIFYEGRVRIAKSPLLTEIKQVKITKFPAYEHSKQVEDDFVAKFTTSSKLK